MGASDPALHQPVMSTIPLLLYTGQFDAFGPAPVADDALSSLTGAYVVHAPYEGHNVLGTLDCFRDIRNAWIENPTAPPDTGCVDDTPPPSFKLP